MFKMVALLLVLACTLHLSVAPPPPGVNFPIFPDDFHWSSHGAILGMDCVQINEPMDPHTWHDNYFCWTAGKTNPGLQWSYNGPIAGQRCTMIYEVSDAKHTWLDNFLCVGPNTPYHFSWSSHGPIPGLTCIQWDESADPHTWHDNFLCATKTFTPGQGSGAGVDVESL